MNVYDKLLERVQFSAWDGEDGYCYPICGGYEVDAEELAAGFKSHKDGCELEETINGRLRNGM